MIAHDHITFHDTIQGAGAGVCTCTTCRDSKTVKNGQARNSFPIRASHVILGSMALVNMEGGHEWTWFDVRQDSLRFVTETQNRLSTRHIQHTQAVGLSASGDEHHNCLKTKKNSQ